MQRNPPNPNMSLLDGSYLHNFEVVQSIARTEPKILKNCLFSLERKRLRVCFFEIQALHDKNWHYTDQLYVTWDATHMKLPLHNWRQYVAPRLDACDNKNFVSTTLPCKNWKLKLQVVSDDFRWGAQWHATTCITLWSPSKAHITKESAWTRMISTSWLCFGTAALAMGVHHPFFWISNFAHCTWHISAGTFALSFCELFWNRKRLRIHPDVHYSICAVSCAQLHDWHANAHNCKCGNDFHPALILEYF